MKREHTIKLVLIGILLILIYKFGVTYFFTEDPKNSNWSKGKITQQDNLYDVVIAGEEPDGIAAALSAARMGARTLLISEGDDLGGSVEKSLRCTFEPNLSYEGGLLNKGIFAELYNKLGVDYSVSEYKNFVKALVKKEKRKLSLIYGAKILSVFLDGNTLNGINIETAAGKIVVKAKRFIDSTKDGILVRMCSVPSFTGSEDLNMKSSYLPVEFNFIIKSKNESEMKKSVSYFNKIDYMLMNKYETSNIKLRFKDTRLIYQGDGTAVVKGMEILNFEVTDQREINALYKQAVSEARDFVNYFRLSSEHQKDIEYLSACESIYAKEKYHYAGLNTLSVNDILNNRDFGDRAALGSNPVDGSKLNNYNESIIGKPVQYSIPLSCLIPLNINNLLMTGSKASYSSLAASSAGSTDISIALGETAGAASVFTIVKGISYRELTDKNNEGVLTEFRELLRKQKLNVDKFEVEDVNVKNFSFKYLEQLRSLGLITAGTENNYGFSMEANEEDLAILLLNGIYRTSIDKYNLGLDNRIRNYFTKNKLTKNKAGIILGSLHGIRFNPLTAYKDAVKRGYITSDLQKRLSSLNVLKMEDVYQLTAYNLKLFTGRELS